MKRASRPPIPPVVGAKGASGATARLPISRPQRVLRTARRVVLSTPLLAALVAVLAWQPAPVGPGVGLDASWTVGLQMAVDRGFHWGTRIVFAFGPPGFLAAPVAIYGGLTAPAAVYTAAAGTGVAAAFISVGPA